MDIEALKFEFRLTNDGDDWGHVMSWLFVVADEIHFERDFDVPDDWGFRPSPLGKTTEEDDYYGSVVSMADDDSLLKFGNMLNRAARCLNANGKSY